MGEEKLVALLQESLSTATRNGAAKHSDFSRIVVDMTVQPKAVAYPTDAPDAAGERTARPACPEHGVDLRQSYARALASSRSLSSSAMRMPSSSSERTRRRGH
jgi:IS5 family transposase